MINFVKLEKVSLKTLGIKESDIQKAIAQDPSIIGLGDLVLRDKERIQPKAGRLDLLLEDEEGKRFEVEIQLGKTDETHIIRTIEYWDIERRRYPQYDHCAVIVAEEITSRFFNVISLFNRSIPIIAIQLGAHKLSGANDIALVFTKILDVNPLGMEETEPDEKEQTDRSYWVKKATPETLAVVDKLLELVKGFIPTASLSYKKFYISIVDSGSSNLFVAFRPRKREVNVEFSAEDSEDLRKSIEENGIEAMSYDSRFSKFRIKIVKEDLVAKSAFIESLLRSAYESYK